MTEDTTLTDEQIAEIEQRMADCEHTDGDLAFVVEALRTSTERVKELESIMTTWNQEELDEAEKQAKLTKTLFDQAERVKVLEDVIEAKQSLLDCCIPDPYYEKASDRYYDRLPKHEDALKKAGMLK